MSITEGLFFSFVMVSAVIFVGAVVWALIEAEWV
jgi:hypothetical protein